MYFSVDPKDGHFITVDPFYNATTFPSTKPEFKRKTKKKKEQSDDKPDQDDLIPEDAFVAKIQCVSLFDERGKDKELYRQTIENTLELCDEEIISPYVSKIFGLSEVNEAVEFIKGKTCTGKVLIDIDKVVEKEKDDVDSKNADDEKKKSEKSKKKGSD